MEMKKLDHGAECEQLRAQMEARAALIYFFVKAAKDMGVDHVELGRRAMFANGVFKAESSFTKTAQLQRFAEQYMRPETLDAFDGVITACDARHMQEQSTYCPLVEAWRRLTDDEALLRELCDIAMYGDRGILSRFPEFEFSLLGTLFDEGKTCRIQVEKGERAK